MQQLRIDHNIVPEIEIERYQRNRLHFTFGGQKLVSAQVFESVVAELLEKNVALKEEIVELEDKNDRLECEIGELESCREILDEIGIIDY